MSLCALKEATAKVKTANQTGRKHRLPDTADMHDHGWHAAVTAALDWWRLAGVDHAYVDEPADWLAGAAEAANATAARPAPAAPRKPPAESPPPPRLADPANWPQTLDAFAKWWLEEPLLAPSGLRRLPPVGPARAALMIVVPMPMGDDEAGLLTGHAGRLLDGFLAAAGLSRTDCYIASACPAHMPAPDWAALNSAGLGTILMHHITLAAPRRLLIFGASGISALLGHDLPISAQSLPAINQEDAPVPVMAARDLEAMLARPQLKGSFWANWLAWTGQ